MKMETWTKRCRRLWTRSFEGVAGGMYARATEGLH